MRFHSDLAKAKVFAPNLANLVFEVRAKLAGLSGWSKVIARNDWFQKIAVAKLSQIKPIGESPVIMAYSYAALEIFKLARARGWRTVLGQIDPGFPEERLVAKLYEENAAYRTQFEKPPSRYWSNWRQECELADRIVVNSRWSKEALVSEGVSSSKIKIVPLAYQETRHTRAFRREYPNEFSASRPLRVLFLGQVNLRKGIAPLFDAIRLLNGEPIEFQLVGPLQVSVPSDLRDHPQVRWCGSVPHEDADQFYREADVFLFPTFSDGFGLTQLEAQAWRLPIVSTKFCGSVVEEGRNGWILPEITGGAIASAIRHCLANPAYLEKASVNSGCEDRFNLARVGEQWLNVFHEGPF
jgi:glycosyltransferase involved in cell wall biosynthesis